MVGERDVPVISAAKCACDFATIRTYTESLFWVSHCHSGCHEHSAMHNTERRRHSNMIPAILCYTRICSILLYVSKGKDCT